jgi:hypothetical protein
MIVMCEHINEPCLLNFTFSDNVNKLQFYYLLTVLFRRLCSSVLPSSVSTIYLLI